jgi:chromosome segregation and condensation protein ScpB
MNKSLPLRWVEQAATEVAAAHAALEAAVVTANRAGVSLRPIAKAAGLSPESVRKIIKNQEDT